MNMLVDAPLSGSPGLLSGLISEAFGLIDASSRSVCLVAWTLEKYPRTEKAVTQRSKLTGRKMGWSKRVS